MDTRSTHADRGIPNSPGLPPSRVSGAQLARVRMLSRLLDSAVGIPGTKVRFGLDALLGLIPGVGDLTGAAASGYIVLTGIRLGLPRTVIARMVGNVALDTLAGTVPILGDLFDIGWRSNTRNVKLLEEHLAPPGGTAKGHGRVMTILTLAALALLAAAGIALTWYVLVAAYRAVAS